MTKPVNLHKPETQCAYICWQAENAAKRLREAGYDVPDIHITVNIAEDALCSGIAPVDGDPREATADERLAQAVVLSATAAEMKKEEQIATPAH